MWRGLCAAALLTVILPAGPCRAETLVIRGAAGTEASLDAGSGRYEVRSTSLGVGFAGSLETPASGLTSARGRDELGEYEELRFRWRGPAALSGSIRTYSAGPLVVFAVSAAVPLAEGSQLRFPHFTRVPADLQVFSYRDSTFAPHSFAAQENGTPWLLFDARLDAAVLSPASHFMIARLQGDAKTDLASTLNSGVANLPAGFTQRTLLAFARGVNAAWDLWGGALVRLQGGARPANDADPGLRYLGYWTDHGATYYYDYERRLGYAGTLEALISRYRAEHIPIRYLQLDSWWYSKTLTDPEGREGTPKNPSLPHEEWNRYGGLLTYAAHPALFPQGLAAFQERIGLPLILHNRWIDPASPYHHDYRISGLAASDRRWWDMIMDYLVGVHAATYEQDWLDVIYERSPALPDTPGAAEEFTAGMAGAARARGLTVQYSMSLPRHFLEAARYPSVTTTRVTPDRFGRRRWDDFLYTSRLGASLGLWPWSDVFMSAETDNLLMATLSAGMVGIGDRIGAEDKLNLLRAVRADGVIVKPDRPLVPIDAMYAGDAAAASQPMIASASTEHGALRTAYVFAYRRTWRHLRAAFTSQEVGVAGDAYVYDVRRKRAQRLAPGETFAFHLAPRGTAYFIVVPVSRSGIALLGDTGKFVSDGRKRIPSLTDEPRQLTATVTFAAGEDSLRLFGYAAHRPVVTALRGSAGVLSYAPDTGRFEVSVSADGQVTREEPGDDVVRQAVVALQRSD